MNGDESTRRSFLRSALSLLVISTAAPGIVLGRIMPQLSETPSGAVTATYTLHIPDFPELQLVGGSVKLVSFDQLQLNPDQLRYGDQTLRAQDDRRGWYPLAVTRVALEGMDAFKTVSTYCTHGFEYQVGDYDAVTGEFVCPHNGSSYLADGTHIDKPETPPVGNLKSFPTTYDGAFETVQITGLAATSLVGETDGIPSKLFMDQNYPNPFNPTTMIRYGLPAQTRVRLTVHTLLGNQVATLVDETQQPGIHVVDFSALDLPSGAYFYRLQTDLGTLTRRMVVSK